MPTTCTVQRNAGHPWDGAPGFDVLILESDTKVELDAGVKLAAKKFWEPWLIGSRTDTGKPGGALYKPSGAEAPWYDTAFRPIFAGEAP